MSKPLEYLEKREWSMGNGQCPDCCGASPSFLGGVALGGWHRLEEIGHEPNCYLMDAIVAAGGEARPKGSCRLDAADRATYDAWLKKEKVRAKAENAEFSKMIWGAMNSA